MEDCAVNVMKLAITISWLVIAAYAGLVIYLETHRNSRMYQYFPRVRGKVTKYCLSAVTDLYLAGFLIYYDLLWIIAIMALIDASLSLYGLYLIAQILWYNR